MDILTHLTTSLIAWAGRLDPAWAAFLMRATLLFGLPTLLCHVAFIKGNRSVAIQGLGLLIGLLLAASLPVQRVHLASDLLKAWVLALCLALLIILPAVLPRLLVPALGPQRKLRTLGYGVLIVLFLLNLLRSAF